MGVIGTLNTWSAGDVISSTEMNSNFDDIKTAFNTYAVLTDTARTISVKHTISTENPFTFSHATWVAGTIPYVAGSGNVTAWTGGGVGKLARFGGSSAPTWSTLTFPDTVTAGDQLYASSDNVISVKAKGTARQLWQMNAGASAPEWASNIDIPGTLDVTGAAVFDSTVTVTGTSAFNAQAVFTKTGQTIRVFSGTATDSTRIQFQTDSSTAGVGNGIIGLEDSVGGTLLTNAPAFAMVLGTASTKTLALGTNSTSRILISSTGVVTVANLAGAGTRNVVVDANGVLSAP